MSDPYSRNLVNRNFYFNKVAIKARTVVVLDGMLENRELHLIKPISRVFPKGTIVELIGTDDNNASPGSIVNDIAYIGFFELLNGGVMVAGDWIRWNGKTLGTIIGYDDTHMPNHQNVIVSMEKRIPGKLLGMHIEDEIIIEGL